MSFEPVFHLDEEMSNADSLPSVDEETEAFLEQAAEIARDVKHFYPVPYIPQLRYFKSRHEIVDPLKRSVGWDLFTLPNFHCTIPVGESRLIPLGIAFGFPPGYYGQLVSKNGFAFQDGIYVQGGVLATEYDGDVNVLLHNFGTRPFHIKPNMALCQMILLRYQDTIQELQQVSTVKQLRNSLFIR